MTLAHQLDETFDLLSSPLRVSLKEQTIAKRQIGLFKVGWDLVDAQLRTTRLDEHAPVPTYISL
jgi:hypothetical protein